MNAGSLPRSTRIVLGCALVIRVVLTAVIVLGLFTRDSARLGSTLEVGGDIYAPDRSKPTEPIAACDLLTEAQVESVLGVDVSSVVQPNEDSTLHESICAFMHAS